MIKHVIILFLLAILSAPPARAAAATDYDAVIAFAQRVDLGVPVSGVVETVRVAPGAHVRKGTLLVALDPAPFDAELKAAQAQVMRADADRRERRRDYDQAKQLYDQTVLSKVELENSQLQSARTEAAYQQALARLERARYDMARSRITAPFDAFVLDVRVAPGEAVANTLKIEPLVVLVADHEYLARLTLPPDALLARRLGEAADVHVGGHAYAGRVSALRLEAGHGGTSAYPVEVRFHAADVLPAGMRARVTFK